MVFLKCDTYIYTDGKNICEVVDMKDVEEILKKADFTQGSNHKEKLRELLFSERSLDKKNCELSDEELDLDAAGVALNKGWK